MLCNMANQRGTEMDDTKNDAAAIRKELKATDYHARLIANVLGGLALARAVEASVSCGFCRKGDFSHLSSCCMARALIAKVTGKSQ